MVREEPVLFEYFPNLKNKVPWVASEGYQSIQEQDACHRRADRPINNEY